MGRGTLPRGRRRAHDAGRINGATGTHAGAAGARREPGGVRRGARRRRGCDLPRSWRFQRPPQGPQLLGRRVPRRVPGGPSGGRARVRDGEHRHQGVRDARRPGARAPLHRAGGGRVHHPGLGAPRPRAAAHAPGGDPYLHAGEHPRRAGRRLVPCGGRRARDALARAHGGRDRRDLPRMPRPRPGGLRARGDLLQLLRRVPALELLLRRPFGQPRHVRAAVPLALRAAGRARQNHQRTGARARALPARQQHGRPAPRPARGRRARPQARGPHEGARLRALRGGRLPPPAGRHPGGACGRGGRARPARASAQARLQPRLHERLPARALGRRDDEL